MNSCFYANILAVYATEHPFSINIHLGTLAEGLGCFPLGNEAYPSLPHSRTNISGICSLSGFGTVVTALAQSEPYLRDTLYEAVPKNISGSTSYHRV